MTTLTNHARNRRQEGKLVFSTREHPNTLQKHLHKQWTQGQNCDLIISAGSCDIPVHSCVASCFSTKIQRHLLHAGARDEARDWYSLVEDGVCFSFHKNGEKRVGLDVHQDVVRVLVGFMYTGSLAVPHHQTLALLAVAQGLGMTVVVDMVEVFINRNPDVVGSQTLAATSGQPFPPQETSGTGQARVSCTGAEACGADLPKDARTLCLDPLRLNIKKEMADTGLSVFLDPSAHMHGSENATGIGLPLPSLDPDRMAVGGKEDVVRLVVKIEQEALDDFPVHFQNASLQREKQRQQNNTDPEMAPRSIHSDDDDDEENCGDDDHDDASQGNAAVNPEDEAAVSSALENLFFCTYCSRSYSSQSCLCQHVLKVHKHQVFEHKTCPHCDQQFKPGDLDTFKNHCREVHGDFVCEVVGCVYRTILLNQLLSHKTRVHGTAYPCSKCKHRASSKGSLLKHRLDNHAPYSCPVCQRKFLNKENFTCHSRMAHKGEELECPQCKKLFLSATSLLQHCGKCHTDDEKPSLTDPGEFKLSVNGAGGLGPSVCSLNTSSTESCGGSSLSMSSTESFGGSSLNTSSAETWGGSSLNSSSTESFGGSSFKTSSIESCGGSSLKTSSAETCGGSSLDRLLAVVHQQLSHEMNKLQAAEERFKQTSKVLGGSPAVSALPLQCPRPERSHRKRGSVRSSLCQLCNKQVESAEAHYQHLRDKHRDASFPCQQCRKSFLRKEGLTLHVRAEHHGRRWTCCHCAQVFRVSTRFLAHCKAQHGDPKPFRCRVSSCRFRAATLKSVESHQKYVHVTERNEVCDKCGGRFPSQKYLRLHQRACLQLEQHLCPTCGEVFSLRQSLLSHINNKHGGERRYSCGQCGQRFSCHANRNRHMRIHNDDFPYMCEVCGQKFRHSNSLKDHTRRKHGAGG